MMTNNLSMRKTNVSSVRQPACRVILKGMKTPDDLENAPFGDIAARIRWHRTQVVKMDLEPYAQRIGFKRQRYGNWESGEYRLSLDGALALRRTYGLSLDFIYEGIPDALPMNLRLAWEERPLVKASK